MCFTPTFLFQTLDRLIFKPWCLPWTFKNNSVSLIWEDDPGVSGQSMCTVTIFTNTSNHGEACYVPTTQANKSKYSKVIIAGNDKHDRRGQTRQQGTYTTAGDKHDRREQTRPQGKTRPQGTYTTAGDKHDRRAYA